MGSIMIIVSNCTEMKKILLLLLHIFSSISSFPQCYSLGGNASLVVKRNQTLNGGRVLPILGPEYEVKFELKINSWINDWGSVFRFSAISGDCCYIGQRALAMWTRQGTQDQLHLETNFDSYGN